MKNTTKEVIKNSLIGAAIGYGVGCGVTFVIEKTPEVISFIKTEVRRFKNVKSARDDVKKYETFNESAKAFKSATEHTKEMLGHKLFDEKIFVNTHVENSYIKELLLDNITRAMMHLDNIEDRYEEFKQAYIDYFEVKQAALEEGFISKEPIVDEDDDEFDYDDDFFDDEEETSDETEEADEMTEDEEGPEESLDRKNAFDIPEEGGENEKSPDCFDAFKNEDTTEEK